MKGIQEDSDRPNVVLLILDSARKDMFGCYGSALGLTPNIDALAREGMLLKNHYSPGCGSAQSHVSIFTGQHSARHEMVHNLCEVKPTLKALPALLQQLGYRTYGHCKASFIPPASHEDQFGLDEMVYPGKSSSWNGGDSFGRLISLLRKNKWLFNGLKKVYGRVLGPEQKVRASAKYFDGRESVDYLLEKLKTSSAGTPVFLYSTLLHPHTPYYPPKRFLDQVLQGEKLHPLSFEIQLNLHGYINGDYGPAEEAIESLKKCYQAELLYADHLVGVFVEGLKKQGVLDSTLLVVTADHGELLGEHGELNHGGTAWEELFLTPCLFYYPKKINPAISIDSLTSGLDILPTIFDMLGEKVWLEGQTELDGQSIWGESKASSDRVLVVDAPPLVLPERLKQYPKAMANGLVFQRVARTLKYKYIWQSNGQHFLFHTGDPEDSSHNCYAAESEVVKQLHQEMVTFYRAINQDFKVDEYPIVLGKTAGAHLTDPVIRQELIRLGYL